MKEEDKYKSLILSHSHSVTEQEINEWLKRNPPNKSWKQHPYEWAFFEMRTGRFLTWWRRNILGWKI